MASTAVPVAITRSSLPTRMPWKPSARPRLARARTTGKRGVSGLTIRAAGGDPSTHATVRANTAITSSEARSRLLTRLDQPSVVSSCSANVCFAVAAEPAVGAPSPPPTVSASAQFARANWPLFVITQTLALLGAAISGVSSRKKRLELAALNEKLRKMNRKDEDSACRYDWDNVEGQCTDRWPGAEALSNGTEALKSGNTEEALEAFQTARAQCEDGEVRFEVRSLTGIKAAAYLAATKGYAACLISFGGERNLKTAVVALKAVEVLAERAGDETVFGTVADALTDLGDFGQAGTYYDKVLAMD